MRLLEAVAWNLAYGAVYLPIAVAVKPPTSTQDLVALTIIGMSITLVLNAYLAFRHSKNKQEVTNHERKETQESTDPARSGVGYEVRTDVDLGRLDAADDDISS